VFVVGPRKTGTASHWKILCGVEPREILVLEGWRVKLAGEKGWGRQMADREWWQDEGLSGEEKQASETLLASGGLSGQCQCQWKSP
jgi:hypothetical protein